MIIPFPTGSNLNPEVPLTRIHRQALVSVEK